MDRVGHQDLELVPVLGQELELEAVRNRRDVPRLGYGLEATHHEAADFLLVIDEAVRDRESPAGRGDAVDLSVTM
jgi:hypothetical protein